VLSLIKEMEAQGFRKPILGNALIWAGAFPQAVGLSGQNVHSIGFNTNEPAPDIKGHDDFAARYKVRHGKTSRPNDQCSQYHARPRCADALMGSIARSTAPNVQKARDRKDGLASVKQWQASTRSPY
jgi:hypothetical protein